MDKNRGVVPKGNRPFTRSTKTLRTPPQVTKPGNESSYICELCAVSDNEAIVRCDECHLWYHFNCVNAPDNVGDKDWFCPNCRPQLNVNPAQIPESSQERSSNVNVQNESENPSGNGPAGSQQGIKTTIPNNPSRSQKSRSTTSSSSRRKALALKKLEEERKLELEERERREKSNKEYLEKKYSILEQDETDDDESELDDEELNLSKSNLINQWTEGIRVKTNVIPQMSSTGANNSKNQVHIDDDIDPVYVGNLPNQMCSEFGTKSNQPWDPQHPGQFQISSSRQLSFPQPNKLNVQSIASNAPITSNAPIVSNAPAVSRAPVESNAQTRILSGHTVASNQFLSQSNVVNSQISNSYAQGENYQSITSGDNIQAIMKSRATSQRIAPQSCDQQSVNEIQMQPVNSPQVFMHQDQNQAFITNQLLVEHQNQKGRTYDSVTPPPISQNVHTGCQLLVNLHEPAILNHPPVQPAFVNQNMGNQNIGNQQVVLDHHKTIRSTGVPYISSQSIVTSSSVPYMFGQSVVPSSSVAYMYGQSVVASSSRPYMYGQSAITSSSVPNMSSQHIITSSSVPYMYRQSIVTSSSVPNMNSQPIITSSSVPYMYGQSVVPSSSVPYMYGQSVVASSSRPYMHGQSVITSSSVPYMNSQPIVTSSSVPYTYGHPVITSSSVPYIHGHPVSTLSSIPSSSYQQPNSGNVGGSVGDNDNFGQNEIITMRNLMSRQVIDKRLAIFAGNPEEWDTWFNRYTSTTTKCNLDNSENLDRLDKCLRGKARDIVKSKLSQTEAVPWIISTLQKVFGRPETVLKTVMKRIREIPPIKNDNLKSIMEFAFEVQSVSTTIESSGLLSQYRNPMLLEELVEKLPAQIKLDWARYKRGKENVTIRTFTEWLDDLADDISTVVEPTIEKYVKKFDKKSEKESAHINVHVDGGAKNENYEPSKGSKRSSSCKTCGKECQNIENCSTFNSLNIEEKWREIKEHKLCRLCLKKHKFPCKSKGTCGKNGCSFKHHHLLHNEDRHLRRENHETLENTISAGHNVHYDASEQVMLKYAPVVLHKNNKKIKTIAFFDDGSQASMLEQNLADELGLKGTDEQLCLLWTENIHRKENAKRVSLEISGEGRSDHRYPLKGIRAVRSLHLPAQTFKKEDMIKKYPYLINAPMKDYENAFPGILIGSDFPKLGIQLKVIEGDDFKSPIASRTRLGWVVYGPRGGTPNEHYVNTHQVVKVCPHHNQLDHEIHRQIKEHFSVENFGVRANSKTEMESKENQHALDLLKKLTVKIEGRYETGLLWKYNDVNQNLPDSYPMALKRLISLEKQGENVVKVIGEKIDDYVAKGYARRLSAEEIKNLGSDVWYLPVFGVVHPKKPEKLRMVFDGAAKTKSVSLNSMLLTGPDELASLIDILRRLREKLIAAGGDVKEMYHQVKIRKEDQRYQLFLYRNGESNRKPDVYAMCVMIFGARCSPSAAQYVKNTNANEFKETHPRAVEAIIDNHYVDDMMDGENTDDAMIKLIQDVKMIHANGGFEIRNFISNSAAVLKVIGVTNTSNGKEITLNSEMKTERVLGMWWDTKLDVFTFSLKYTLIAKEILNGTKIPTKRELLRTLMSIFDPLGLLSNYLVQLKILLQDIWRMDLDWDEQLSSKNLVNKWQHWLKFLPAVESVQIPRLYSLKLISKEPKYIEIHTFVDASTDAFSAVSYIRIEDKDGVASALMGSKARVAPLKYLSIPRKELQSAVLGTRLMTSIIQAQRFKINRRVLWSDSETVLSWLKSDHRKYSQFVAHRVGEILESTDVNEWRWVPTKENVADEATKCSKFIDFKSSNRWFNGPEFLLLTKDKWPKRKLIKTDVEEEMKAHCAHASLVLPQLVETKRFSKWTRMVRAVAYSIRFRNLFTNQSCRGTPLSQEELTKAENEIFRQAQFEGYPSEMVILERNKSIPLNQQKFIEKPSPLYDGSPYLDSNGILRMKSRIDGARDLSQDSKRPIILPRDSRITRLLIQHYHVKYFHQNHKTVINEINQRFYVPCLRVVLKKVRSECQMCKVKLAKIMEPQMADLPQARLATFAKPFSYVGVDYFGPMNVKVGRRNEKRWGVLFTCLTIRAVHIELASSLDTDSCLLCIGNFIADRGPVIEFHSDCGTNFVGANNELKKELGKLDLEKLKIEYTSRYTNWVFNPPAAAHMGGSWERLIRSVKSGIYNTLPTRTPKEETLRNMLKEIQNVINSRPLTFIPLEVEEDEALTPNHFLLGSSNGSKPPCKLNIDGEYLRQSWKEAQRLTEHFWNRFIKEYLPTIARRTKWFKPTKPLTPNDLVLVVDEKNPRNTYPKAKVLETKIGSNGQVRRAKVQLIAEAKVDRKGKICQVRKTALWRPAHKLAVLDVLSRPEISLADRETGGRMLETNDNTGSRRDGTNNIEFNNISDNTRDKSNKLFSSKQTVVEQ